MPTPPFSSAGFLLRSLAGVVSILALPALTPGSVLAQRSLADVLHREQLRLEHGKVGRGDVNELRFDDHDNGYTGLDSQKNHFNHNGYLRPIGSFAVTPTDKITALANFSVGPEQNRSQMRGGINNRFILDTSVVYTEASRRAFRLQNHGTTPDFPRPEHPHRRPLLLLLPTAACPRGRASPDAGTGAAET